MTVKSGQMCWILIPCVHVTSEFCYCLRWMKLSAGAGRSSIWDSGLLHSHPHLPCKYSSRIKRAPLASRPLADLTGPVRYRSSSVACQIDCSCSPSHRCARHLPCPTIQRKFELWHSWTHKGALKSGPAFSWRKKKSMCGWLKWRYGPHGLPKGPSQRTRPS